MPPSLAPFPGQAALISATLHYKFFCYTDPKLGRIQFRLLCLPVAAAAVEILTACCDGERFLYS